MQVYIVHEKGTPLKTHDDVFRNFHDIEKSIKISWCKAVNLKIEVGTILGGPVEFKVSGDWPLSMGPDLGGQHFETVLEAIRFPVWDSPTHL